ncbi:hypothetical protein [uncultured Mediterranean phage]|mgnify:CR=1 FL=1|nr:hypothetical protein [uncultured Mediterranean phage]|tara:strand:+ start:1268 stop:1477 length:210 start_codon:yes stop_codon:yes gene_type:complete
MPKSIKFTIRQDGTVTEEVTGTVSNECEELTKLIDNKLGTVTQKLYKPEYYQQKIQQENVSLQHNKDQA